MSKIILWEIMIALDEAGEEDVCSLLKPSARFTRVVRHGARPEILLDCLESTILNGGD